MPAFLIFLGGLGVIALIYFIMGKYDYKKDPSETEDGRIINLDEYEHKIRGENNYPPVKKIQNN